MIELPESRPTTGSELMPQVEAPDSGALRGSNRLRDAGLLILVAALSVLVTVARRPDALFHAQFWAEDGKVFFEQAWNTGRLHALVTTYSGYLELLPRAAAFLGVSVGLRWAPLTFNLAALVFQVVPAVFFASRRCQSLVPGRGIRLLIAAVYLLLPNAEIDLNITNVQWHVVLLAFLIIVATPPRSRLAKTVDCAIVVASALTGPFGLLLVPIAAIWYWRRRAAATLLLLASASMATAVQLFASFSSAPRPTANLGASLHRFVEILANRLFLAGSFGQDQGAKIVITPSDTSHVFAWSTVVVIFGLSVFAFVFWRGPLALRLFIAFSAAMFVGGLVNPAIAAGDTSPQWPLVLVPVAGGRYFFLAELAWILSLMWALTRWRPRQVGAFAMVLVGGCVAFGVIGEWSYPAFPDLHPDAYAARLARAPKGTVVAIPENPSPLWTMHLVAR